MTEEESEIFNAYKDEVERCYEIAMKLDSKNPELSKTFTGTPSERIKRQLFALGVFDNER